MKFIDLFCGIGGFRIALEKQGLQCVFSSDNNKTAQEAYYKNFNEKPHGDITKIAEEEIPNHDILCGGFPCQSFSQAGKKLGMQDKRGQLFYEIIRIAKYHQPKILLLENVRNILSIEKGKVLELVKKELSDIGYEVYVNVLNPSFYGIPQARVRVYFVCLRKDKKMKFILPEPTNEKIYLEDVLEDEDTIDEKLYLKNVPSTIKKWNHEVSNQLTTVPIGKIEGGQTFNSGTRIYSPKGHAVTLMAESGGLKGVSLYLKAAGSYLTSRGVRYLTILECKRIMGFPDNHYVTEGRQGYKQLGNAVIPKMIECVYKGMKY